MQFQPIALDGAEVVGGGVGEIACPGCGTCFKPARRDKRYCSKPCAKAATRNASRGSRDAENKRRNEVHYRRAAWLSFDVLSMSPIRQRKMILSILEAASSHDAALRNILLDPALLGADRESPIGKLYPNAKCQATPNLSKMVNAFCKAEWGCGVRDAILDRGKPANRPFAEVQEAAAITEPEQTYWQAQRAAGLLNRHLASRQNSHSGYDWRLLARAMRERGWQRYFTTHELDGFV